MRIVTRPDFDGIVCAVLLYQTENITGDTYWVEPNEVQTGKADIKKGDIVANLPWSPNCSLWFDHHVSNKPEQPFKGGFDIAPSAARVVYNYYKEKKKLDNHYDELIFHTDIIDAADLNRDMVQHPENYPYIILSMTIKNDHYKDIPYWNRLVGLLTRSDINTILKDPEVKKRCTRVVKENAVYGQYLIQHTKVRQKISITDFRSLDPVPGGNRFLIYSLFPESIASVKIKFDSPEKKNVQLSIGRSIFTPGLNVNIGRLLAQFGGGGHAGAGGCTLKTSMADNAMEQILEVLYKNQKE